MPIDPQNWDIITDGMYNVTQPGLYHTAGAEGLPGIDFAGKTGTAQQMSHEALGKTNKGRSTYPNVWFVGVMPRRNPELVVAVLWQNGEFSYYPARIGAAVVKAFVDKKRRQANNLPPTAAHGGGAADGSWRDLVRAKFRARQRQLYSHEGRNGRNGRDADSERALLCGWQWLAAASGRECAGSEGGCEALGQTYPSASSGASDCDSFPVGRGVASPKERSMTPMRRILSFRDFDWALLGLLLLLCAVSVVEVHSTTLHTKFASFGSRQIFWITVGAAFMFIFCQDRLSPRARLDSLGLRIRPDFAGRDFYAARP